MSHPPKIIYLETEQQLGAYIHPLRQRILRELALRPEGLTAKQLADRLGVAPSSTGHHLATLEKAGLVVLSHTQVVHGFTAKYYKAVPADVRMSRTEPAAQGMRDAFLRNTVQQILQSCLSSVAARCGAGEPSPALGDIRTGVIYLTPEQAEALSQRVLDLIQAHSQPAPGAIPYEFALMAYTPEDHP